MKAVFNFPIWSQRDPRWANILLGSSSVTIGNYGCLLTSLSMQDAGYDPSNPWTPDRVNALFKAKGGYVNGNLIVWDMINRLLPNSRHVGADWTLDTPAPLPKIKWHLDQGGSAIVQVGFAGNPDRMHFLLVLGYNGDDLIFNDPWYGDQSTFLSRRYGTGDSARDILVTHYFVDAIPNTVPTPVAPTPVVPVQPPVAPAPPLPVLATSVPTEPVIVASTVQPVPVPIQAQPVPVNNNNQLAHSSVPVETNSITVHDLDTPRYVLTLENTPLVNLESNKAVEIWAKGKRFWITQFAITEDGQYYVISKGNAGKTPPLGLDPTLLAKATQPAVDSLARPVTTSISNLAEDDNLFEEVAQVTLESLSRGQRAVAKGLHALFGDWDIFKKDKGDQ